MAELPPLRFTPLIKNAVWGGRRLGEHLGKTIGEGDDFAESWEIVDHGDDQSLAINGPIANASLHQLVTEHGEALLGRHHPQPVFPLLLKFLDAHRHLSVQVHPDDEGGAKLNPPDLGKTEAWVVLHAEPEAVIYAGLKRGFDRDALEREVSRGTTELCLHKITPRVGDCIFIPAGTVHALGGGLMVAEIQQASNTTFRLFDWNRVGSDGQPRELHIEQALDAIDYDAEPVTPQTGSALEEGGERLVACDKFILDRYELGNGNSQTLGGDNTCHLLTVIQGEVTVAGLEGTLKLGDSALLPACCEATEISANEPTTLLAMRLP